jgi:hypothetical protein
VFLQKSAQAVENKRQQVKKERQESSRVRKALKRWHLGLELCERLANERGDSEGNFAEVRQGKELTGWCGTSWDIIPCG